MKRLIFCSAILILATGGVHAHPRVHARPHLGANMPAPPTRPHPRSVAPASDTLLIELNRRQFAHGDTVSFACHVPGFLRDSIVGTLHVIIEDLRKNRRWKYRYPIIKGEAAGDLVIKGAIPDGEYAVNFVVQKSFFHLDGKIKDYKPKLNPLSYLVMAKDKEGYMDKAEPGPDGSFRLKSMYFDDTAYIVFSPAKKYQAEYLWIDVRTPLDSAFTAYAAGTRFIRVGAPGADAGGIAADPGSDDLAKRYHFNANRSASGPGVLPDVVVKGRQKKLVDKFNEEYSCGLFKSREFMLFDGLESDLIAHSLNVYEFLKWQVPGFTAKPNNNGGYNLRWRNAGVTIFLDEFPLTHPEDIYINTADIAMIKVYAPPSFISGKNGVIAIYTKRGAYDLNPHQKNRFKVAGYTNAEASWE
ncbi:MAG TPA: hypothetical protein VK563_16120 [Puia sp.]|nr:hypothetical protein [Puia sp.]